MKKYLTSIILILLLLTGCTDKNPDIYESENGMKYELSEKQNNIRDYLTLHGRFNDDASELKLYWTDSGFSLNFVGTGAEAEIETLSLPENYCQYLNVYLDGSDTVCGTVKIDGEGTYTLASGLPNTFHTLEVRKRTEAISGVCLEFKSIRITDGAFVTTAPDCKEKTIEFIGDSITCGFGNLRCDGGYGYKSIEQDGGLTYAHLTSQALGAENRIIARSGIGFMSRDGISGDSLYDYYTKTASLPGDNLLFAEEYDFENNPADVIVINLGTNDNGFIVDDHIAAENELCEDACDFIRLVRENNPDSIIIWAYGLMGNYNSSVYENAVNIINSEGDSGVYYLPLNPMDSAEGYGSSGHPSVYSHIRGARELTEKICSLTGWEADFSSLDDALIYYEDNFLK